MKNGKIRFKSINGNDRFGAHNYHPLEVVISKADGIWVENPEGKRFIDMLSTYSAVNQGHRHPKIIKALKDQAEIIVFEENFHGRTTTIVSFSTDEVAKDNYGYLLNRSRVKQEL